MPVSLDHDAGMGCTYKQRQNHGSAFFAGLEDTACTPEPPLVILQPKLLPTSEISGRLFLDLGVEATSLTTQRMSSICSGRPPWETKRVGGPGGIRKRPEKAWGETLSCSQPGHRCANAALAE